MPCRRRSSASPPGPPPPLVAHRVARGGAGGPRLWRRLSHPPGAARRGRTLWRPALAASRAAQPRVFARPRGARPLGRAPIPPISLSFCKPKKKINDAARARVMRCAGLPPPRCALMCAREWRERAARRPIPSRPHGTGEPRGRHGARAPTVRASSLNSGRDWSSVQPSRRKDLILALGDARMAAATCS